MFKRGDVIPIYRPKSFSDRTWYYEKSESKVMGEIDGYLMVRNKGCVPFIVYAKDVVKWIAKPPPIKLELKPPANKGEA